eukprot:s3850_g3.t1
MAMHLEDAAAQAVRRCQDPSYDAVQKTSNSTKLKADLTMKLRAMDMALEQIEHTRDLVERSDGHDRTADSFVNLVEDSISKTSKKLETLETDIMSQMHEESALVLQKSEHKMNEFQLELTTALEQHLSDAERLLDTRVREVRAELLQQLASVEAETAENRTSISKLAIKMQERLEQMESSVSDKCLHLKESSSTCAEALEEVRSQSESLQKKLQLFEEETSFSKEQLQSCRLRTQQLQDHRDEFQMEICLIKQRLQLLQEEVFSIAPDLERRNQKLEDMLRQQIGQVESKFADITEAPLNRNREVLAAGPLPAAEKGPEMPTQVEVQDLRRRLEEFRTSWPGSIQAERAHLDDIRAGLDTRISLAQEQIHSLELRARESAEAESKQRETLQRLSQNIQDLAKALSKQQVGLVSPSSQAFESPGEGRVCRLEDLGPRANRPLSFSLFKERLERTEMFQADSQSLWQVQSLNIKTLMEELRSAPWCRAISDLECELKALLAGQVEDSAAALHSVAQMIEAGAARMEIEPRDPRASDEEKSKDP